MLLHDTQEFDDDFGAWADEDLSLPSFFGVVNGIERIIENTCLDHCCGQSEILNSTEGGEVSVAGRIFHISLVPERKECPQPSRVLRLMSQRSRRPNLELKSLSPFGLRHAG